MTFREYLQPGTITAGVCLVLLVISLLICGCMQVEPEELPPQTVPPSPPVPVSSTEHRGDALTATVIIIPEETGIITGQGFSGY